MNMMYLIMLLTLFLVSSLFATTVYKWIDEDGHVHYGHQTKNKDAEEITIKKHISGSQNDKSSSTAERVDKQKRFLDAMDEENKSINNEKRKKTEEEEKRLQRCNAAKDQLKRAEESGALYDLDEKGNRILLNKKQYELAIGQARARVEHWCN